MSTFVAETDVSVEDVYLIGAGVLNWISASALLGHCSMAGGLDYIEADGSMATDVVRDFVSSAAGHKDGSFDRLRSLVVDSGWQRAAMDALSQDPVAS